LVAPAFERALQHLTWTYRDMRRYQKMIEIAKRYVSASGSTEAYNLLNDGDVLTGQFDLAMKTMQSARELFPKRYEFTGSIAKIYRAMGMPAEAEKESTCSPPRINRSKHEGSDWAIWRHLWRSRGG